MIIALIQEKQNKLYNFANNQYHFETREELKFLQKEMIQQNLDMLEKAGKKKVDLALTSEAINFPGQPSQYVFSPIELVKENQQWLIDNCKKISKKWNMYIVIGMFLVDEKEDMYNSVLVFNRNGEICFRYDKNFLAGQEKDYLKKGNSFPVWESEFGNIGIAICWDMQFPEVARNYALQKVDLILCPTWGWEKIYGHSRAYENGIYIAASMAVPFYKHIEGKRTPSEVITPEGKSIKTASKDSAEILYVDLPNIKSCAEMRKMRMYELMFGLSKTNISNHL